MAFICELAHSCGGGAQGELGCGVLGIGRGVGSQPLASGYQVHERASAKFFAQVGGGGDDERFQHVDRGHAGNLGAVTCSDERAQALPRTATTRRRPGLAAKDFPRGSDSVQRVGLGAVLGRPTTRVVELDDELTLGRQCAGQSCAEAARRLDRPCASAGFRMQVGPAHCLAVAAGIGAEGLRGDLRAGCRADDCGGDAVAIRVDADHVIDKICQGHLQHSFVARDTDSAEK